MFDFGEILVDSAVKDELAQGDQRNFVDRPELGGIQNVKVEVMFVFVRDDLNSEGPLSGTAALNRLFEIFAMEVCRLSERGASTRDVRRHIPGSWPLIFNASSHIKL